MLIEQQFQTIDACRFCFMCRHVCTLGIATGRESDTPRGKGLILFKILKGHCDYSDDLVETIYRCCQCGMCRAWCKGGYTMPETVLQAREDIVALGQEPAAARAIKDHVLKTGNPYGLPAQDRLHALQCQGLFKDSAEVLYYVGCDTAYHQPEIANAFLAILARAGVDFTLIEEETSSGKLLTMLGYRNEAKQVAESLLVKIRATGCRTLVTTCPSSFDAFKNDYPALGLDLGGIEVLHATQYLEGLLAAGKIAPQKSLDAKITVQDSDCLCRGNEICDPPRRVLQSIPGVQLAEMTWTREFAHSCGETGGVFALLYPELSKTLAKRMLAEAADTGASVLATSCPVTKRTLLASGPTCIDVRDTVELLAESL